jgi:uroporphyrinogen decarboxylase
MSFLRENVVKVLCHEHPVGIPRGELFLGKDFLDHYFQPFKGQYIRQVNLAARSLGLSAVGIDLNGEQLHRLPGTGNFKDLDEFFAIGCSSGPVSHLINHLGFFKAVMTIRKTPFVFLDLTDGILKTIQIQCEFAKTHGLCALAVTDDIAWNKGLLFSPTDFMNHVLPSYQRIAEMVKSHGLYTFFHSDGNTTEIIDGLIEAGYACIHPVDTQAGLDLYELKKKFGQQISFMGHIDLLAWNEDRIKQEIHRAENEFKNGGLILGSAGGLSMETTEDKIGALYPPGKLKEPCL